MGKKKISTGINIEVYSLLRCCQHCCEASGRLALTCTAADGGDILCRRHFGNGIQKSVYLEKHLRFLLEMQGETRREREVVWGRALPSAAVHSQTPTAVEAESG